MTELNFSNMCQLLSDKDCDILDSICNSKFEQPYLVDAMLYVISDEYTRKLSPNELRDMFKLLVRYNSASMKLVLHLGLKRISLEKLVEYTTSTVYYTKCLGSGIYRIASKNEVESGILELEPDITQNTNEDDTKLLCMLAWQFSGKLRYYKMAGYSYTYKNNRLLDTPYDLIKRAEESINNTIEILETDIDRVYELIERLEAIKKKGKYKYPDYAVDDIVPELSIKQIVYMLQTTDADYFLKYKHHYQCLKLIESIKNKSSSITHLTVEEKQLIRRVYNEIQKPGTVGSECEELKYSDQSFDSELKDKCDRLLRARDTKVMTGKEFVFKVIFTLMKSSYSKCSEKQMAVIDSALEKLDEMDRANKNSSETSVQSKPEFETQGSLSAISELLGKGML